MSPGTALSADVAAKMSAADLTLMNVGFRAYGLNDKKAAYEAWRMAADGGLAEAQLRVGLLYEGGEGINQDMIEAYRWLKLAALQGQPQAVEQLKLVSGAMAPAERAIAESLVKDTKVHTKNGL